VPRFSASESCAIRHPLRRRASVAVGRAEAASRPTSQPRARRRNTPREGANGRHSCGLVPPPAICGT
jgi:hypothetical protein